MPTTSDEDAGRARPHPPRTLIGMAPWCNGSTSRSQRGEGGSEPLRATTDVNNCRVQRDSLRLTPDAEAVAWTRSAG